MKKPYSFLVELGLFGGYSGWPASQREQEFMVKHVHWWGQCQTTQAEDKIVYVCKQFEKVLAHSSEMIGLTCSGFSVFAFLGRSQLFIYLSLSPGLMFHLKPVLIKPHVSYHGYHPRSIYSPLFLWCFVPIFPWCFSCLFLEIIILHISSCLYLGPTIISTASWQWSVSSLSRTNVFLLQLTVKGLIKWL